MFDNKARLAITAGLCAVLTVSSPGTALAIEGAAKQVADAVTPQDASANESAAQQGTAEEPAEQPAEEAAEKASDGEGKTESDEEGATPATADAEDGEPSKSEEPAPAPQEPAAKSADNATASNNAASDNVITGNDPSVLTTAKEGSTYSIKLDKDYTFSESNKLTVPKGVTATIDLNGYTISTDYTIVVEGDLVVEDSTATGEPTVSSDYETVTYKAGSIENTCSFRDKDGGRSITLQVESGGKLTHKSGTIKSLKDYTVSIQAGAEGIIEGGYQVGQEGGPGVFGEDAHLSISGGVMVGLDNSAVAGNGGGTSGGTKIDISGGTIIGHIQSAGYIAMGIYHPQAGELNITGGTIYADGGAGIVMRAGKLNMTGGSVVATGTAKGKAGDNAASVESAGIYYDLAANYTDSTKATNMLKVSGSASVSCDASVSPVMVTKPTSNKVTFFPSISGGSFSGQFDESLLAAGTELKKGADGNWTIGLAKPVIFIGEQAYSTLTTAFDAAKDGDTIKLIGDVTVKGTYDADALGLDGDVTLDLNGHTVYGVNGNITIRSVDSEGTLTVENGTIDAQQGTFCTMSASNSNVVLDGVQLKNVTANGNSVKAFAGGHITLKNCTSASTKGGTMEAAGGTIDVYDCAFTQNEYSNWNSGIFAASNGSGTVNVYGGTFTSQSNGIYIFSSGGTVNFYGGMLDVTGDKPAVQGDIDYEGATGSIAITGGAIKGKFKESISEKISVTVTGGSFTDANVKKYVANGYEATQGADGIYGVAAENPVASIGDRTFASVQDAIDAAVSGETVTLTTDTDIRGQSVTVKGKSLTFDLNGHTVDAANNRDDNIQVTGGGALTLTDSTDTKKDGSGKGSIKAVEDYVSKSNDAGIIQVDGKGSSFTMESGFIDAVRKDAASKGQFAVTVMNKASVAVNGGKIEAGWYAISGNGNAENKDTKVTVNGGTLVSTADYAIYHPQEGELTVNGGVVYGAAGGISMNNGKLTVAGGTITSKGQGSTGDWGDGTGGQEAAAINIQGEYDKVTATVTGGTFIAEKNAVLVGNDENGSTLIVSGGTFTSDEVLSYMGADNVAFFNGEDDTYAVTTHAAALDAGATARVSKDGHWVYYKGTDAPEGTEADDAQGVVTLDAADLIAYEGGQGTAALPNPEWSLDVATLKDDDGKSVELDWGYYDEDTDTPVTDMATVGTYELRASLPENVADEAVTVETENGKTALLDLPDDGVLATVSVRDVTDDERAAALDTELFRPVFNGESPRAEDASDQPATLAAALAERSAADDQYDANGAASGSCDSSTAPHAHIAEGLTFYTNGDEDMPVKGGKVTLLWDDLLPNVLGSDARKAALKDKAVEASSKVINAKRSVGDDFKYIDLVDVSNGNAWVATADGVDTTVFYPYPEGASAEDDISVVWYDGLTRDYTLDLTDEALDQEIKDSKAHALKVTKTDAGVLFDMPSGKFGAVAFLYQHQVDASKLSALVKQCDDKGLSAEDYTADTWKVYADALAHAKTLLANEDATQDDVDAACAALQAAVNGLKPVETTVPDEEKPGDEKPTDEKPAGEKPADEKPSSEKPEAKPSDETLVQTGDSSLLGIIAAGLSGITALGAGIVARRKRK